MADSVVNLNRHCICMHKSKGSKGAFSRYPFNHQMIPVNVATINSKIRTTDIASDMTAPNHSGLRIFINP